MLKKIFTIEKRFLGDNCRPLIVPEIGINHNGNLKTAFQLVDAAKECGAEIIKHQTHVPYDEMSEEAKKIKPGNSKNNIYSIISNSALNEEDEFKLCNYIKKKNMIFLSTPFSRAAAVRLNKFGVNAFKIGSGEFNNLPFLEFLSKFKKNIILSTGMHSMQTVKNVVNFLNKLNCNYALMHTTSLYPTPDNLVKLESITEMKRNFPNKIIGYSDHTIGINACLAAIAKGANIIEKHFTDTKLRRGPDIICSMDKNELKKLILGSDQIYRQCKGNKSFILEENVTRKFAFASVVAINDIKINEKFTLNNIWVKRPGTGYFPANKLNKILSKKAKKNIKKNFQLKKNDVQ
jgi:N-acetylneuraminate synthase